MDDNAVAIVAARRSVIGRFNGSLKNLSASQMGAAVLQQCLKDVRIETASKQAANYNKPAGGGASSSASSETVTAPGAGASSASGSSSNTLPASLIEEVIVGQVLTTGTGQNPARQTCLMAGLPETTPSLTINKVCGSGLKSVHLGMLQVMANSAAEPSAAPGANSTASLIACGGQESMSNAPHFLAGKSSRLGQKMGDMKLQDSMLVDGLTCAFNKYHMGITAENIASKYGISRKDQDEFALSSQKKAQKAISGMKAAVEQQRSLHPFALTVPLANLKSDEHVNLKIEKVEELAKLKPAFKPAKDNGTVTAGNASGLNDGAAFVILTTVKKAKELNLPVLATIKAFASAGVDPKVMGLGPIPATKLCLEKAKWTVGELDLVESNEAFAAQSLAVLKDTGFKSEKVNVNGGAIALGHPIGASGTRILVDLIYELRRQGKRKGLATMCIGGGQGVAIAIENPSATAGAAKL
ncbi:unnamed protein product [Amoebophrya sp. A120]|nr:unnamed protein product [Amoebophrya sp. A120]|eukprot:GSA120T00014080001.1